MSLFGDFSKFLEDRLDEFLQNNPHLELQVLEDELRQQEADTIKLISEFERKEQQLEAKILETAESIQLWHGRATKARQAGKQDLASGAAEREAALLREGNQLWAQRKAASDRLEQARALLSEIQRRRSMLKAKAAEFKAQEAQRKAQQATDPAADPAAPSKSAQSRTQTWKTSSTDTGDPLEQAFQNWEMEDELEDLKRNMKR